MNWSAAITFALSLVACAIVGVVTYWIGREVGYTAGRHAQKRASNGRFIPNAPAKGSGDVAE